MREGVGDFFFFLQSGGEALAGKSAARGMKAARRRGADENAAPTGPGNKRAHRTVGRLWGGAGAVRVKDPVR